MTDIGFDFNNMFSHSVGKKDGVSEQELAALSKAILRGHKHLRAILESKVHRVNLGLEWAALPYQEKNDIRVIQKWGDQIAFDYENVIFLGIGGSYLGLKAAQDALKPLYYNEFASLRGGRARVYFEGNNLDPEPLSVLLKGLDPKKTFIVVISKSGETTETKAVFDIVDDWLARGVGSGYGRQILAITDPVSGSLRKRVDEEQSKDAESFRSLPLLKGVGGRFSEFNMGLLHLAVIGISIEEVFEGCRSMAKRCEAGSLYRNPSYLYAALHYLEYRKKGKSIAIMMPFSESLRSTADWYCQLLAESLGKKYGRRITTSAEGFEVWTQNEKKPVNVGRTPIATRGTTDLHSIQQNNIEGENNKVVTMIRLESFRQDLEVPAAGGFLAGKKLSGLLSLAQEATAWALVRDQRPNCTISLKSLSPSAWGGLLYFFEMATTFEGELLNINAFDQPGVEGYKNYMYYQLQKPGISLKIAKEIKDHPLKKKSKYIL